MILSEHDTDAVLKQVLTFSTPDRVYLFGSNATGHATARSDVDLLLIGRHDEPIHQRGKHVAAALRSFPAHFDILCYTARELEEELADPLSFASTIIATGRLIYDRLAE